MNFRRAAIALGFVTFTLLQWYPGILHFDSGSQLLWFACKQTYFEDVVCVGNKIIIVNCYGNITEELTIFILTSSVSG